MTSCVGSAAQSGRASRWLLVLLLLGAAAAAWWLLAPQTIPESVRERLPEQVQPAATNPTLYKWKDDQGRWNITDQPPKDRKYEAITVDPDTNVLPAGVAPEQD
ncbi:MAG: DUF4124 domain-containing protein [Lysobacterales bacterium]